MQRLEDTSTPMAVSPLEILLNAFSAFQNNNSNIVNASCFYFFQVGLAILGYSLCSSTLLLANKMAIEYLPVPSVVSFIQIISSAIAVLFLKVVGVQVDNLEWDKVKAYAMYIVAFVAAIYANMQALSHSNVETVIVFRACSPISVTIIEYFFMDRAWPSLRSSISLGLVAVGALIYCMCDSQFALNGISAYSWVITYFFLITFEMTYGKKLTSSVKMDSVWGPVLYCNLLASLPMFLLGYSYGDYDGVYDKLIEMPVNGCMVLLFSCVAGTLIGYIHLELLNLTYILFYTPRFSVFPPHTDLFDCYVTLIGTLDG